MVLVVWGFLGRGVLLSPLLLFFFFFFFSLVGLWVVVFFFLWGVCPGFGFVPEFGGVSLIYIRLISQGPVSILSPPVAEW